jgi:hypothetical protein
MLDLGRRAEVAFRIAMAQLFIGAPDAAAVTTRRAIAELPEAWKTSDCGRGVPGRAALSMCRPSFGSRVCASARSTDVAMTGLLRSIVVGQLFDDALSCAQMKKSK